MFGSIKGDALVDLDFVTGSHVFFETRDGRKTFCASLTPVLFLFRGRRWFPLLLANFYRAQCTQNVVQRLFCWSVAGLPQVRHTSLN